MTKRTKPKRVGERRVYRWGRPVSGLICCLLAVALMAAQSKDGIPKDATEKTPAKKAADVPPGLIIQVELPITDNDDKVIRNTINQAILARQAVGKRPVIVLEFINEQGSGGNASDFYRALSVAHYLSSEEVTNGARTVAYLNGSIKGHAVLSAMACQRIIASRKAEFGQGGIIEDEITDTMRSAYRETASRRGVVPPAIAIGMLDPAATVYRVQTTNNASRYVLQPERDQLDAKNLISKETAIVPMGELALLDGVELRTEFSIASHLASNREELAEALSLPTGSLQENPKLAGKRRGVLVTIAGRLNGAKIDRAQRGLQDKLNEGDFNLVCVRLLSSGGAPKHSIRFASYLATLDPNKYRTIAFVDGETLGDSALIAMACDDIIMLEQSRIGGPGEFYMSPDTISTLKPAIKQIAKSKGRTWSLALGMVDNGLTINRYRKAGGNEQRFYCKEEFEETTLIGKWEADDELDMSRGMSTAKALEVGLAVQELRSFDELKALYQLDDELEEAEVPWIVHKIELLAQKPWFPRCLLFIGFFALMSEASAPGLGAPGFVALLAFLLFFWTQFLNGTANYLEVLLFVGGLVFIGIELLVLPGFGIFGIGGIVMVLVGIVLASQTFVIPLNAYQVNQMPRSLLTFAIGITGAVVGVVAMRKLLPHTPYFRKLILPAPNHEDAKHREQIVSFDHLIGRLGVATTRLSPAGKARFDDELVDVISDGEMLDAETVIEVLEVHGNRVVVAASTAGGANS